LECQLRRLREHRDGRPLARHCAGHVGDRDPEGGVGPQRRGGIKNDSSRTT
jgi:hypothetical protein